MKILLIAEFLICLYITSISGLQLVWNDEFDGNQLDTSKWEYQIGDGKLYGLDRWGNNEDEWYLEKNVRVNNGHLIIEARREDQNGYKYSSGRIRTINKGDWKFGKVEVRAKAAKGQGVWPAIWMLPTDNKFGQWPRSGEIDLLELRGQQPNQIDVAAHYGDAWDKKAPNTVKTYSLSHGYFTDDFHIFGVEWGHDYIHWYVDNSRIFSIQKQDSSPYVYPFNEKFHLILNVAVGGNYAGYPGPDEIFPTSMEVDWVRVYQ